MCPYISLVLFVLQVPPSFSTLAVLNSCVGNKLHVASLPARSLAQPFITASNGKLDGDLHGNEARKKLGMLP